MRSIPDDTENRFMSRCNQLARAGNNSEAVRLATGRTGGCLDAICGYYAEHIDLSDPNAYELGTSENVFALQDTKGDVVT